MLTDTYLSFYLTTYRIHILSKTVHEIGDPPFIRFLVHEDGKSMLVEAYTKKEFQSHKLSKRLKDKGLLEINSYPLCKLLINRLGWAPDKSYRVPGKTYPAQKIAVYDLTAAEQIQKP